VGIAIECKNCNVGQVINLVCNNEHCAECHYECAYCKGVFLGLEVMEYRGKVACASCDASETLVEDRERERREIIQREDMKTKGLNINLSNDVIGRHNRKLLAAKLEVASKESIQLKEYEGRL